VKEPTQWSTRAWKVSSRTSLAMILVVIVADIVMLRGADRVVVLVAVAVPFTVFSAWSIRHTRHARRLASAPAP
jgi:hypothetical protein